MTENKDAFADYKSQSLTRPRDEAWGNWYSWKDKKVGDKIQGYVADAFYRPEEEDFRPQRGITLRQVDGTLVNVGVKDLSFVLAATDNLRVGDPLTIELVEIQTPKSKGKNGAKIFKYYGTNLPENASNKTVKELDDEDRAKGGSKQADVTEDTEPFPSKEEKTPEQEAVDNF